MLESLKLIGMGVACGTHCALLGDLRVDLFVAEVGYGDRQLLGVPHNYVVVLEVVALETTEDELVPIRMLRGRARALVDDRSDHFRT